MDLSRQKELTKRKLWRVAALSTSPVRLPYYGQMERCVDGWLLGTPGDREKKAPIYFLRGGYRGFELAGGIEAGFRLVTGSLGDKLPPPAVAYWTTEKKIEGDDPRLETATFPQVLNAYLMTLRMMVENFDFPLEASTELRPPMEQYP